MTRVVLDPGHGGSQRRGSSSPNGERFGDGKLEQHVNFALAERVARHLGGVPLTRGRNENRSLRERIDAGRRLGARAFVSLHSNAHGGRGASGIFVHKRASRASLELAEQVRAQLRPAYGGRVSIARGDFAVLSPEHHEPDTAACLVDIGYLDGGPVRSLASPTGLDAAAGAIARAIRTHLGRPAPVYGRRTTERGLDVAEPILNGSPTEMLQTLSEWITRQVDFVAGVADTQAFPFSAICKVIGSGGSGTAFYVAPNKLLTAGHVVEGESSVTVVPGMNGAGVEPFGRFTVSGSDIVIHPSYVSSSGTDIAVLKTSTPPPNGQFFDFLDPTPASMGEVAISGYAAGDVHGVALDSRKQHVDVDFIRNVSDDLETADYNATTNPGSSGSPVFYTTAIEDEEQQVSRIVIGVVGVHVSGLSVARDGSSDDRLFNLCNRFTDAKLDWIDHA